MLRFHPVDPPSQNLHTGEIAASVPNGYLESIRAAGSFHHGSVPGYLKKLTPGAFRSVLSDKNQANLIDAALGNDQIPVGCRLHIANDTAAARYRPALKLLRLDVETHQHIR